MKKEGSCRGCFDQCLWCGSWLSQTAWHSSLCMLDVRIPSICSVSNTTDPTDPEPASSIKGTLLWVTPAVVTRGWLHFTATFYHSHHIWNRGASGPSESDKSKRVARTGAARVPATGTWYHWFQVWSGRLKRWFIGVFFPFSSNCKQIMQSLFTCFCVNSNEAAQSAKGYKMKEHWHMSSSEIFGWEETSELTDSSCWVMYSRVLGQ